MKMRTDAWLAAAVAMGPLIAAANGAEGLPERIRRAGNTEDDAERVKVLRQIEALGGLSDALRREARRMAAEAEKWVTSKRLDYFGRSIGRTLDYDFGLAEGSPFRPLARLYRGRMLVWVTLESGNIIRYSSRRRKYLDKAVADLRAAARAFPENRVIRMYLGEPIPWRRDLPGAVGAPTWAALQREGIERLTDIIEWWIDHRMQSDGQYGGGWGDDCEMWRWWVPVLVGFDSSKIAAAQARFSAALMAQGHMKHGYTSRMSDVEHTAEDSADVITPMMHLAPDDEAWKKRALRLAGLMETLWTGRNRRGQLQFRSTYFTVDRLDDSPQRACDTVYHPRAVQPALLYWQRMGDERLGKLISAWMDTWVNAAARVERGKPAGIIPSAIHWPDGWVGGLGENWWDPRNHGEPTLYEWPSAMGMMCDTLLLTWHMTGKEKYLRPLRSMAAARLRYLRDRPRKAPAPGTEAWCAKELGFLAGTLAKYKRLSGSAEFDELLARDGRGRTASNRDALTAALGDTAKALRVNRPGYTREVRYTDRVLRFPVLFDADMMFREAVGDFKRPDTHLLYSTVTGDPGQAGYFPLNAVRWLTPPRDIAALVTEAGTSRFAAELYHFGGGPRPMAAELYLLRPGRYALVCGEGGKPTEFTVTGRRTRIAFTLPPRKPFVLRVRPVK